jgi:transposase
VIGLSPSGVKVMVATKPVDFRRGMNGLVALVASALSADPYCGDVFVFRAKRLDRRRCIYWDGSGMILATKRFKAGKFVWHRSAMAPCRWHAKELEQMLSHARRSTDEWNDFLDSFVDDKELIARIKAKSPR